jgi:AAA ATPase domain
MGYARMRELAEELASSTQERNEATTRLHLIDRLLFDCLGWTQADTEVEDHQDGQFADYVLDKHSRRLVLEAKKEGVCFELPDGLSDNVSLETLYALGGAVTAALQQVTEYAGRRGIPYAAICNGHQLAAFVGSRQDGIAPRKGRAMVFASPQQLVDRFDQLWEVLGPTGTAARRLTRKLNVTVASAPPKLSEQIADYPGTVTPTERQIMLGTLGVLFKPEYERDNENEDRFLRECYCQPGAYSRLSMLNRGILRTRSAAALGHELRIGLEEARTQDGLSQALVEEVAITASGREPIVLLGPLGVGKTIFLRRLLRVDAHELAGDAVSLYVDLGRTAVFEELGPFIANAFREQLQDVYDVDIDSSSFLRGTYQREVAQFAKGIHGALRESDPTEYTKREIARLEELSSHTESHLARSLTHLVTLRRQQVIIVLDNIDQRNQEDQEQTFVLAETMAKGWPCTVFVTLRPDTFNASRLRGKLSAYQPRAFTIEPPRPERVVVQRLKFGLKYYEEQGALPQWFGWTTSSDDLQKYLDIMLRSFQRNERLQEALINLSGASARRALELARAFAESPHSEPEKTIERDRVDRPYVIPHYVFIQAVLLGDAAYYSPEKSRIPNLFDISTPDRREHFLLPILLGLLRRGVDQADPEGYVPIADVFAALQDLGFEPDQVEFAIRRALDGALVDALPPDRDARAIRLSAVGAYAHDRLALDFQYIDAVVIDLPVADSAVRERLAVVRAIRPRLERASAVLSYLDECWETAHLGDAGLFDWAKVAAAVRADMAEIESRL